MNSNDSLKEIDFLSVIKSVVRRIWIIALAAAVGGALSFLGLYFFAEDTYEAKAVFYVSNYTEDGKYTSADIMGAKELARTYMVLLRSDANLEKIGDVAEVDLSADELYHMIKASAVDNTEVFEVFVSGKDKKTVEKIAAAIVLEFPDSIEEIVPDGKVSVVDDGADSAEIKEKPYKKYTFALGAAFGAVACVVCVAADLTKESGMRKTKKRPVPDIREDELFSRKAIEVNSREIGEYIKGKTVLVTGGGGSIGGELCRQIAGYSPEKIVVFDIYENSAYLLAQEILKDRPDVDTEVVIGSVRDRGRIDDVFSRYNPDIVFHAAAHKHVPLMETSPCEAIKNNVFGTWNTAAAAHLCGAEVFVLISTDKAVNPTSIMGASKRICEMIVKVFAEKSETKFACVRFGNVMESSGSVIPLFKQQIETGGPVTVTHKDVKRYFMTIPEAVSLVLQAGAYAKDGEIFILDMGEPVRIDDLARRIIRLYGFEPGKDIAIEYTGLRAGEKLYEELLLKEEGLRKTANDLIFVGRLEDVDAAEFEKKLAGLKTLCEEDSKDIKLAVADIVPTYRPAL